MSVRGVMALNLMATRRADIAGAPLFTLFRVFHEPNTEPVPPTTSKLSSCH